MKTYIKLEGLVYKPDGWSEEDYEKFVDKMIEITEEFGEDVQLSMSCSLQINEALDDR